MFDYLTIEVDIQEVSSESFHTLVVVLLVGSQVRPDMNGFLSPRFCRRMGKSC